MSSNEKTYEFHAKEDFLEKLEQLVESGIDKKSLSTLTPFHVHEVEHILETKPSALRFFTLVGALSGFFLSFVFIIFTVLDWPLITGGKPLLSIPAFIIVSFECTILFGGIVSMIGFLHLSRLPDVKKMVNPRECGNRFIIIQGQVGGDK